MNGKDKKQPDDLMKAIKSGERITQSTGISDDTRVLEGAAEIMHDAVCIKANDIPGSVRILDSSDKVEKSQKTIQNGAVLINNNRKKDT